MKTVHEIEQRLAAVLTAVGRTLVPQNRIDPTTVRRDLAGDVRAIMEDQEAHGEPMGDCWYLSMMDGAPVHAAQFWFAAFSPATLRIYVGKGRPRDVITISESFSLSEVEAATEAFVKRFGIDSEVIEIPRRLAEEWLAGA